ncbi:MAG: NADH-quinone oxidoreductase subunit L [Ignavibacteria bacterium]|nr:NADH-quinone oxidoreductase subunit L [Ignavibacteria bacterium]
MINYAYLIPLFPLIGFFILGVFGKFLKKENIIGFIGNFSVLLSFIITSIIFIEWLIKGYDEPRIVYVLPWISTGEINIYWAYQIDQLSITFSLIVTGVGFLIHLYSIGYMHKDRSFYRFFAYMNLFIFMMLNLVLANSFLLTFLGWEGVGLCSYLLIGFWYDRKFEGTRIEWTGDAANKAFIVNRIGDFGFLIAMFLLFINFQTLNYKELNDIFANTFGTYYNAGLITAITLLLFLGCTGKSAQIPLAVWLPDAMAGPTPVSALIHAATMVTSGIFLVARNATLFSLAPTTMLVIAVIGTLTAFFAATIGVVQNDIKKVLAYSTVSQLGFMFAALGVGAFVAGVFHVMTHAFFKGLLFLGAGSVIHGMHEEQNIKRMGGLRNYMPKTYFTFFIATLSISGIPFFSGFFSKDEILWKLFSSGNLILWIILVFTAFFTAFYMFRLLNLVFFGTERFDKHHIHPHESPKIMTLPLQILAILSAFGGFIGIPYALGLWLGEHPNLIENWLNPVFEDANRIFVLSNSPGISLSHQIHIEEYLLMILSIIVALSGIFLANKFYSDEQWSIPRKLASNFKSLYKTLYHKYYVDEFYFYSIVDPIIFISNKFLWKIFDSQIIDGIVNGSATVTIKISEYLRRMQTGFVQNYALMMFTGIIIIFIWILLSF